MIETVGRFSTTARLWLAAALTAFLPASDALQQTHFSITPGFTLPGTCNYADAGTFCTPDSYIPGTFTPGTINEVAHSQLQFLAPLAVIALIVVASRRRTLVTRRVARSATLLLAACLVIAVGEHRVITAAVAAGALILAVPPVWRRVPDPGVLDSEHASA